jgi:uncharacterized membrane protein YsdA (DUF1294 family)
MELNFLGSVMRRSEIVARLARAEIFDPVEIVAVQLIGKTVCSCYLMGFDKRSGNNFDHRKRWIEDRLRNLSANFGMARVWAGKR